MVMTIVALVVGAYLVLVAAMYVFQRNLLYIPDNRPPDPAASGVPEMREVRLKTADGLELISWHRAAASKRPTIIYFHGNGGNVSYRASRIRPYLDRGYGLLLVEYRGYGGNPGRATERGLYNDGRAAMTFIADEGVPVDDVVLYGESLGGGIAVEIAAEQGRASKAVGALVLEAPLSSVTDVAAYHYPLVPVRWLLKDRFESASKIGDVRTPVFIIHGENDRIVPTGFGRALFETAKEPKESWWVSGGGHEDLHHFGLQAAVIDFLARHVGDRR
jgi:fermentation-respiration switch protein FrsA (DUF1100 family)